jgi:hypothetical protein
MRRLRIQDPGEWLKFFMELAERAPYSAVHASYHWLNAYLRYAVGRLDPERVRYVEEGAWGLAEALGLLAPGHEKVIERLGDAWASAAKWDEHERVSRRQAREFVLLVARLVSAVQERLHMLLEAHEPRSTDTPKPRRGRRTTPAPPS